MRDVLIGQVDYTVLVKVVSTSGAPVTALAHTDIDIAYARVETDNDVTTSDITPVDLADLTAAHSDWGWEEVSSTDHPGLYRLDVADAVFVAGAWEAVVTITDASGTDFYAVDIGFRLVDNIPTAVENADALLNRNVAGGSSSGRLVKEALYALRNKWEIVAGAYNVYQTDDSTLSWSTVVSADPGADHITGSDPS